EHRRSTVQPGPPLGADQHRPRAPPGQGGGRPAVDRHPGRRPSPPPVRRQPAEADQRPLAGRRVPDPAAVRPDPRHRRRHQAPDLRPGPGAGRRRGGDRAVHQRAARDRAGLRPGGRAPQRGRRGRAAPHRVRDRAAHGRPRPGGDGGMTATPQAEVHTPLPRPSSRLERFGRRQGWVVGVALLLAALVLWRSSQIPAFGAFEVRGIVAGTMTLALLAMAQTVIVISGGIDLSVGAMMVLGNCIAARLMLEQDLGPVLLVAVLVVVVAMVLSGLIGTIAVVSGVPDIVVTLAASFILSGLALIVLDGPGGGTNLSFQELLVGGFDQPLPATLWLAGIFLLVWVPFKRSRLGIATYAVGSDRAAAFLSGLNVGRTRIIAYVMGGFFSGLAGVVTTAFTGSGEPRASIGATATLTRVAAVVLGGVNLMGGSGTLLGPVLAAFCLALIPPLMLGLGW